MAGNYFFDPRPFYGSSNNMVSLDELFNGRKEVAPWMDHKKYMVHFEEYPSRMEYPRPGAYTNQREDRWSEYRRPQEYEDHYTSYKTHEVQQSNGRDDTYMEYKRPQVQQAKGGGGYDRISQPQNHNGRRQMNDDDDDSYDYKKKQESNWWGGKKKHQYNGREEEEEFMGKKEKGLGNKQSNGREGTYRRSDDDDFENYAGAKGVKWADSKRGSSMDSFGGQTNGNKFHGQQYGDDMDESRWSNQMKKLGGQQYGGPRKDLEWSDDRKNSRQQHNEREERFGNYNVSQGQQLYPSIKKNNGRPQGDEREESYGDRSTYNGSSKNSGRQQNDDREESYGDRNTYNGSSKKNNGRHQNDDREESYGGYNTSGGHQYQGSAKKSNGRQQNDEREERWGDYEAPRGQQYSGVAKKNDFNEGRGESRGMDQQKRPQDFKQKNGQGYDVEMKVPLCCDNCERKVKNSLANMDGVEKILCDQWTQKVSVRGNLKPENVLRRVRRVKKEAQLWQQSKQF